VGAEARVGEGAEQDASSVGAEATVEDSMAAFFKELRDRNEEFLQTILAQEAEGSEARKQISEAWNQRWQTWDRILEAAPGIEQPPKAEKPAKASPYAPGGRFGHLGLPAKASPFAPGGRLASSSSDYYNRREELTKYSWI
jgi:hypothetical protein